MDFRDILEKIVAQIDSDFADGEDVSQSLWDLKVEAKIMLRDNPR